MAKTALSLFYFEKKEMLNFTNYTDKCVSGTVFPKTISSVVSACAGPERAVIPDNKPINILFFIMLSLNLKYFATCGLQK